MIIRPATPADVEGIARVHVQAWHEAYSALVPPEEFEHHSLELRNSQWRATLSDPDRSTLICENKGTVAGFVSGGPIKWTGLSTKAKSPRSICSLHSSAKASAARCLDNS